MNLILRYVKENVVAINIMIQKNVVVIKYQKILNVYLNENFIWNGYNNSNKYHLNIKYIIFNIYSTISNLH